MNNKVKVSIIGSVGLPANYGGWETLVENLVEYFQDSTPKLSITVFCSGKESDYVYKGANLKFINLSANGISSIFYDGLSLLKSILAKNNYVIVLGVSGAIFLPLARFLSDITIITNLDGIEWKRDKWSWYAKAFLRLSEYIAVKCSHKIISDNQGISEYVTNQLKAQCLTIPYGGDHAIVNSGIEDIKELSINLPTKYSLSICRIEPENNIHLILDSFSLHPENHIVFIGNWLRSTYGKSLFMEYNNYPNIHLYEPIYDLKALNFIRKNASSYCHGHSVGGTNPSLVEMMHFDIPIIAYDCIYNRATTLEQAYYFKKSDDIAKILTRINKYNDYVKGSMIKIANESYTWEKIGKQYAQLFERK